MENLTPLPEKLVIIRDEAGIDRLLAYLDEPGRDFVAYDTETTGLDLDATVIGFSVACETDLGFYVITHYWDKANKRLVDAGTKEKAKEVIQKLTTKQLITHNGIVDVNWTKFNFGIDLMEAIHTDTMVLAHLTSENRASYGLKELAFEKFGADAKKEQVEMKTSVIENGGVWEDKRGGQKEMYKADADIIAKYGAKDTILTLRLFYVFAQELIDQDLVNFFYEDESMPQFRTCTYQLNMTGLKVDVARLKSLQVDLEKSCARLFEEINFEIYPHVKDMYPGTSINRTFNIGASQQLAWLLFIRLGNDWKKVTKRGREEAKRLIGKAPYSPGARKAFMQAVVANGEKPQKYIQCDKKALMNLATKYTWVAKLLEYRKELKLLKTYAIGMQKHIKYGVIYPSFLQHGTTSGRYSSRAPNFQNLPRDDKRIKSCIISRPGKVFVGADYSQLEPRTFTSQSQDPILMAGFKSKEDFYSVIGIPVFNKYECSANKKSPNYLGTMFPYFRQVAKVIALSLAYGTTPFKLADELRDEEGHNLSIDACTKIRDDYFEKYKGVAAFVRESHLQIVNNGVVFNQFGRPRRIPAAKVLKSFGFPKSCEAADLPYQYRSMLNLACNHRVQSTAASIVNRAAIAFCRAVRAEGIEAPIVLQVHDEIIVECAEEHGERIAAILKDCMENTVQLEGVALVAEPKIARNLADLK
jgi:DNA polymerase-1